jgi:hypothetical protein
MGESSGPGIRVVVSWGGEDARGLLYIALYEIIFVVVDTIIFGLGLRGNCLLVLRGVDVLGRWPSSVGAGVLVVWGLRGDDGVLSLTMAGILGGGSDHVLQYGNYTPIYGVVSSRRGI